MQWNNAKQLKISALRCTGCVILGKLHSLSVPQLPLLCGHRDVTLKNKAFTYLAVLGVHFSSVQSLGRVRVFGLQHTRLSCPSPTPFTPRFEFGLAQTQVHWVGDAMHPSHPLSSPSPPALNLSQHQGLFQWVGSSHQVAKVLELQRQSFQQIFSTDFPYDGLVGAPCVRS